MRRRNRLEEREAGCVLAGFGRLNHVATRNRFAALDHSGNRGLVLNRNHLKLSNLAARQLNSPARRGARRLFSFSKDEKVSADEDPIATPLINIDHIKLGLGYPRFFDLDDVSMEGGSGPGLTD